MVSEADLERYVKLDGKFPAEAQQLLEKGDFVQASEKFWGAAAEIVKAVAESRG